MGSKYPAKSEIARLFQAKIQRRKELSRLPFEEKILILLDLQKTADEIYSFERGVKARRWAIRG